MSKANRRRQRPGNQPSTSRPTGSQPAGQPGPSAGASSPGTETPPSGGTPPGAGPSGAPGTASRPATLRPTGTGSRPTSTAAGHGRRERQRATYKPSFMERYRTPIIVIAALAAVALLSVFVFFSASQPIYACSTIWTPEPTASPSPDATENLGYVQPDQGNSHESRGDKVTYTYCAPASGSHFFVPGVAGPIPARVYGPSDNIAPQGWIHNLEHGGLVILYQGTSEGAAPGGQAKMKAFYEAFPPAQNCGPVIARFDQMSSPFQAILWGRVLPLQTFDEARIKAFWEQWGGRTNPEKNSGCPTPNPITPTVSSAPSAAPGTSAAPTGAPTPAPSATAPAAPSAAAPSPS